MSNDSPPCSAGLTDSGALKLFLARSVTSSDSFRILRLSSVAASKAPRVIGRPTRVMLIRGFGSHSRIDWRGARWALGVKETSAVREAGDAPRPVEGWARADGPIWSLDGSC